MDKYKNYVRIIDYKTGNVDEKVKDEKFYTGQNLQLYLYMNAFVRSGEEPAGAYYYAVNDSFRRSGEDETPMAGKTLSSDEIIDATDKNARANGKSSVIDYKISKKTGKPGGSSTCDDHTLRGYMKYAKKLAEKAVTDITDGVIVASPYEKSCDYCEYGAICGYDEEAGYKERKVSSVKPETIVEAAYGEEPTSTTEKAEKEAKGGENDG